MVGIMIWFNLPKNPIVEHKFERIIIELLWLTIWHIIFNKNNIKFDIIIEFLSNGINITLK